MIMVKLFFKKIDINELTILGINNEMKISSVNSRMKNYLKRHREDFMNKKNKNPLSPLFRDRE